MAASWEFLTLLGRPGLVSGSCCLFTIVECDSFSLSQWGDGRTGISVSVCAGTVPGTGLHSMSAHTTCEIGVITDLTACCPGFHSLSAASSQVYSGFGWMPSEYKGTLSTGSSSLPQASLSLDSFLYFVKNKVTEILTGFFWICRLLWKLQIFYLC